MLLNELLNKLNETIIHLISESYPKLEDSMSNGEDCTKKNDNDDAVRNKGNVTTKGRTCKEDFVYFI